MSAENVLAISCACKGVRTCLLCEVKNIRKPFKTTNCDNAHFFSYCYLCNKAWPAKDPYSEINSHPFHRGKPLDIPGVLLVPDFITQKEEQFLVDGIDKIPWVLSQSGRRKQDFGPRVNFKKRKIRTSDFQGLPSFTCNLIEKISSTVPKLKDFKIVELCHLEYLPERGSSIDPHIDDCWLWGEHLVTVNLLSNTVLTLSPVMKDNFNQNQLECHQLVTESQKKLFSDDSVKDSASNTVQRDCCIFLNDFASVEEDVIKSCNNVLPLVQIPLPQRSLLILFGPARYIWNHAILRENIHARRIAMTFRELSLNFLEGGINEKIGTELLNIARNWISIK